MRKKAIREAGQAAALARVLRDGGATELPHSDPRFSGLTAAQWILLVVVVLAIRLLWRPRTAGPALPLPGWEFSVRRMKTAVTAAIAAWMVCSAAPVRADVIVSECGTVVPGGTVASLAANLDCSAFPSDAITLGDGSALELKGFSLTGSTSTNADGVHCTTGCRISGPGTISGFGHSGVTAEALVRVFDATIADNAVYGVHGHDAAAFDSIFRGNATGMFGEYTSIAERTSFLDNTTGMLAAGRKEFGDAWKGVAVATDSILSGNLIAISSTQRAAVYRSLLENNQTALSAHNIISNSSTLRNNYRGLYASGYHERPSITVTDSLIEGCQWTAVDAFWDDQARGYFPSGTVTARDSVFLDNAGMAVSTFTANVAGTEIRGGGGGIDATRITVKKTTIADVGVALRARDRWNPPTYNFPARINVRSSTITDNRAEGISSQSRAKVQDSTIDENCSAYTFADCADIETGDKPSLASTTCGTSRDFEGADWDVCSMDP